MMPNSWLTDFGAASASNRDREVEGFIHELSY